MTNPNEEFQGWIADWHEDKAVPRADDALKQYVRRRSRHLIASLAIEASIAIVGAIVLVYLCLTRSDLVERAVMGIVAVACVGTLVFGWWNWRGAFNATSETTAVYLDLASSRLIRFRRALFAGWILLGVEATAFTIWLTYRATLVDQPEVNGAIWPWLLLAGMCGGAAHWLTVLGRWVRREATVVEDLRREYDDSIR